MDDETELDKLKADNEALRALLVKRNEDLFDALSALSSMWNQYCPPPWTHMFMNAGEEAEEVLQKWKLIRANETSIYIGGIIIDDDVPDVVLNLLSNSDSADSE